MPFSLQNDMGLETHCGIEYFEPSYVRQAKKDHYWAMTGKVMAYLNDQEIPECYTEDGYYKAQEDFECLTPLEKQKVLTEQRSYMRQQLKVATGKFSGANLLPLSFVRDKLLGEFENAAELMLMRKKTAHSYKNEKIAEIFQSGDRVYIPLLQFMGKGDKNEAKQKDDILVLSRHPYDLARMATARVWPSCMEYESLENLKPGEESTYHTYVGRDIQCGTLIAYGVYGGTMLDADWNITAPFARCLIKPYTNCNESAIYHPQNVYMKGSNGILFKKAVDTITKEWLCRDAVPGMEYVIQEGLYPTADNISDIVRVTADYKINPVTKEKAHTP